jgi:hypothetical protein
MAKMKRVLVHVSTGMTLEQCQKTLVAVLNRAGHPTCYSGINIAFETAVDPETMVLHGEKDKESVRA